MRTFSHQSIPFETSRYFNRLVNNSYWTRQRPRICHTHPVCACPVYRVIYSVLLNDAGSGRFISVRYRSFNIFFTGTLNNLTRYTIQYCGGYISNGVVHSFFSSLSGKPAAIPEMGEEASLLNCFRLLPSPKRPSSATDKGCLRSRSWVQHAHRDGATSQAGSMISRRWKNKRKSPNVPDAH